MRQIAYNNSAFTMRLEYPISWDVSSITGVNIAVDDFDGGSLLSATAATLYTATTLNAATSIGDSTITLASGASAVVSGDRLHIAASSAGPEEECEVLSYNSSTRVVTLRHELVRAHTSGTAVRGLWCTYDLDTSTVATWTKALQVIITWTPAGSDDLPLKERGEISASSFSMPDFSRRFEILFPREWKIAEYRIKEIYDEARLHMQIDLNSRDLNIDRVVDTNILMPALLSKARWLVVVSGGDQWSDEREVALDEYNRQIEILTNQPIWLDENQDSVKDDVEVDDYSWIGLERGI